MGDFNHPDIYWRDTMAMHRQRRRFLECVNHNFLTQVIEEPRRRGAMLDPAFTNREEPVGDAVLQGSLGSRNEETVELKILRAVKRAH